MAAGGNGDSSEKRHTGKVDIAPGCQVWCKTRFEEIQGTVTAYDRENGVIIVKSPSAEKPTKSNLFDVSIVNLNHLQKTDFKLLSTSSKQILPVELDHGKITRRLEKAIAEKMQNAEKIGVNVSNEAQALFDSIERVMPECKWDGDHIVVMDDVRIGPPYRPENCSGPKKDSLERLKKMVKKFHDEKNRDSRQ